MNLKTILWTICQGFVIFYGIQFHVFSTLSWKDIVWLIQMSRLDWSSIYHDTFVQNLLQPTVKINSPFHTLHALNNYKTTYDFFSRHFRPLPLSSRFFRNELLICYVNRRGFPQFLETVYHIDHGSIRTGISMLTLNPLPSFLSGKTLQHLVYLK